MKLSSLILAMMIGSASLVQAQVVTVDVRTACHPQDVKHYDTERLRSNFAVEHLFPADGIHMTYAMYDRFIVGGACPVSKTLKLEAIDQLKAPNFLARREIGIINVGGPGKVRVGDQTYRLGYKEALYVGAGSHEVYFSSDDQENPARFYFNSAPAHRSYPTKLVTLKDANKIKAGSVGMTELKSGSVWNTMPAHVHARRMEAYFYFEVPEKQRICHFMGEPQETRHIWLANEQAVISPEWSIHAAAGTSNYTFIWGMAGENLDYGDQDPVPVEDLK